MTSLVQIFHAIPKDIKSTIMYHGKKDVYVEFLIFLI